MQKLNRTDDADQKIFLDFNRFKRAKFLTAITSYAIRMTNASNFFAVLYGKFNRMLRTGSHAFSATAAFFGHSDGAGHEKASELAARKHGER